MKSAEKIFWVLGIALLFCCTVAFAEPVSDAYGSIQFQLPDGFSLVEKTDEYKSYASEDGEQQIMVGALFTPEQLNRKQFLSSIDDILDIFVAMEQAFASEEGFLDMRRTFVGDLPSIHMRADIDGLKYDLFFLFNRYDSIVVRFQSCDNAELVDYFIDHVTARLSPL